MSYSALNVPVIVYLVALSVVIGVALVFAIDYYLEKTEKRWRDGE